MTVYEYSGIIVTKKVSSTFRVIIEISKVLFVWIFEIIYYDVRMKYYQTSGFWLVFGLKLFGYAIIIFGNLLLNEIIEVKCCELNRYFGKEANRRQVPRHQRREYEHHRR